jgi:catechol 2,3-dioxygenase-like lactoylglutathione lyase family enzyme
MIAVSDVEASSRWYQKLLGLRSDHGGSEHQRLLSDGAPVLQLHHRGVEDHHGLFANLDAEVGHGVLLWLGEVGNLDAFLARANQLKAPMVRAAHRVGLKAEATVRHIAKISIKDHDGYSVVIASSDRDAYESP